MTSIISYNKKTFIKKNKIIGKHDLLMISLTDYFSDYKNMEHILNITNGKSPISLRIIDWFVTNYAKKKNTSYSLYDDYNKSDQHFIVYLNYKLQLKAYSKKQFDPFCRRERIAFYYIKNDETKFIKTTVGQLNFFRWAIQYKILDYIMKYIDSIENDMNSIQRLIYQKDKISTKSRRKRKELSIAATKTINRHNVKTVLHFN